MLLDNLKDIFLKALKYTPALEQKAMIDLWNKECDSVWKDKEALIKETRAACRAGISPEEIAHAKDLLAAEKDGRLVTLPCNVGDTVYKVDVDCVNNPDPTRFCFCWNKACKECEYSYLRVWESHNETTDVRSIISQMGLCGETGGFGKTVFLTRAEAEKALGKEQGQ